MRANLVLVANIGSTSFKFRVYRMPDEVLVVRGGVERIGAEQSPWSFQAGDETKSEGVSAFPDYEAAISWMDTQLASSGISVDSLAAVGFKPVAADRVSGTQVMDESVLEAMQRFNTLFPAHNPPYIAGVRAFRHVYPRLPCIGTFETAFYDHVPAVNQRFPVPLEWQEKYGIRRHGFHGASHRYVTQHCAEIMGRDDLRIISCHLGGSSSIAAVQNGIAVNSSWGMTPQSGLPQNNRVGDFDVFALIYLIRDLGLGVDAVEKVLTTESGLKGLSGLQTGDIRDIVEALRGGNPDAALTFDFFVNAIRKYIGQFLVELNGADAIIFTAGIGENSSLLRERVCADLDFCGILLDREKNATTRASEACISAHDSKTKIYVIPTNEEIIIARNAWAKLTS